MVTGAGGVKADEPGSDQGRLGLVSSAFECLILPSGLLVSVYTNSSAAMGPAFSWVYKFLSFLGSKDYQLVTWSRDQTLRMWRIDSQLQRVRKHLHS